MILHFLAYQQKTERQFAAYVLTQFSRPGMLSEFVIMSSEPGLDIPSVPNLVRVVNPSDQESMNLLLDSIDSYSGIVMHGLFYPWCETVLRSIPDRVKVAWMFWGGEVYYDKSKFLAPVTKFVFFLRRLFKQKKDTSWHLPLACFRRIDFCLTGVEEEYEYVRRWARADRMQHIWYTYYSIEDTVGGLMDARCHGDNVWICNSAAIENNVFDVVTRALSPRFRRLLKNRKVIIPLSYGPQWVRSAMLKVGPIAFPGEFSPLLSFLPRSEYNEQMLDCSTMLLPYYRPAAQGNIITALWLGMRVYLSEKSMIFGFFKRLGVRVFSYESEFCIYGCQKISEEDFQNNRRVLSDLYSKRHIDDACMDVVKALS